jgi:HD-like signal output (HDOD) protein
MPERRRILFVDDEPNVLSGYRRMLHGMRGEWDLEFAPGAEEALARLAAAPFDVVVSDMRMPGMEGADLLKRVKEGHPHIVRIGLSGHASEETALKCVGPVHQYLTKPCDAETLRGAIARVCALKALIENPRLQAMIAHLETLPALGTLYAELTRQLTAPDVALKAVAGTIGRDVGLAAKLLQLVNSAFFGVRQRVVDIAQAVMLLGLTRIRALALTVKIFTQFDGAKVPGFSLEALWRHSLATGERARAIVRAMGGNAPAADDAALGGMLHDVGKLILADNLPAEYGEALADAARGEALERAERARIGATHAQAGTYLLGLWGFPDAVRDAVAFHARPRGAPPEHARTAAAVHVADAFAKADENDGADPYAGIDTEFLRELGCADALATWRAAEVAATNP